MKKHIAKIKANKWKFATIVLAVLSIVLLVMLSQTLFASPKKAADKAIDYINKNLLSQGNTATLVSVDKESIGNLRKFTLEVAGNKFASYVSVDGKYLFTTEPFDMTKEANTGNTSGSTVESTGAELEGGFSEAKDTEVCKENDKPIVYFFGSSSCPHCKWEEPILRSVVEEFGDAISYHENIDSETDLDVFSKYSTGSVPTLVIGCKYYRIGSGEASGEEAEKTALKQIICKATDNLPANICQ